MAVTYLLDTSVLTRLRISAVRARIKELLLQGTPSVCQMSLLEMGFSARSGDEWRSIQAAFDVFEIVTVTDDDQLEALRVQRELAELGLRGRKIADLLIAACSARCRATLLHYDSDFEHIASVTGQKTEWVLPRGSID